MPISSIRLSRWLLFAAVGLAMLACGIQLPDLSGVPLIGEPTPVPTATPDGDSITFRTLTYRVALAEGEAVPGTGLRYIRSQSDGFDVTIDGLPALKRSGDSFVWRGVVAPGVVGQYDLRLTTTLLGELIAVGPVHITVLNPAPVELSNAAPPPAALQIEELLIDYLVPVGRLIPGTTRSFIGLTDQGAQLAGTTGYPYLRQADSLTWTGQLRSNVILRYDLRVSSVSENGLRLVGTAKLWINP